jgi:hypothetical protein
MCPIAHPAAANWTIVGAIATLPIVHKYFFAIKQLILRKGVLPLRG